MSYNGNGVFLINTAGQPVIPNTVISATTFNLLTADLANGLTNAITKDGQTTVTANIPMSNFKITGLGAATTANDAVRLEQLTSGATNVSFGNLAYTGTLTGGTGVVNIGSGQIYKDASGNVGIGTSSPLAILDILRETASGTGPAARFYRNQSTIENLRGLSIYGNQSGGFVDSTLVFGNTTNSYLAFGHHNGTSYSERMRIDSSGNLLVGTTTVNGRISSVSKSGFAPNITAGTWANSAGMSVTGSFGGGFSWIDGSGGYCAWAENGGADFVIAGGLTGNVVANGVFLNGFSATSWSARSDERLKQNLQPITDALNKTCSLRAVTGAYKNFPDEQQAFLLAQDVQKVLPEAVCVADKRSPEQYLGLAYTQIIPLLVAAIQELKAEIDLLKGN